MKTLKSLIIILAVVFSAVSCGSKSNSIDASIAKIEKAIEKVEKNKTSMTEADWKAFQTEVEEPCRVLDEAMKSDKVGTLKKLKISAAVIRVATVAGEAAMPTAMDSLNVKMQEAGVADSISAASDKIQEVLQSDEMKDAAAELQKVADELRKLAQ
ncbi:MAG: hypothetical protein LBN23_08405 [Paludibacter sp.]|jgi:soluble cytochrome b562|nr:hypothetical protein [Paludibacter sp.]